MRGMLGMPARTTQGTTQMTKATATTTMDDADVPNPAGMFIPILLNLVFAGTTLSARHLCILCFWAVKMGCTDPLIKRFSYKPSAQSGKFQAHIDKVLGVSTKRARYKLPLPTYIRGAVMRQMVPTPVLLPWEELLDEIFELPTFEDDLIRAVRDRRMPPPYYANVVVQESEAAGETIPPVPLGIFIDAAPQE